MTMMAFNRPAFLPVVLILLILVAAVVAAIVVRAAALPAEHHAVLRHGTDAQLAYDYIEQLRNLQSTVLPNLSAADHCRYSCGDGRDRFACRMRSGGWAVAVYEGALLITAWISDKPPSFTHRCAPFIRYAHP